MWDETHFDNQRYLAIEDPQTGAATGYAVEYSLYLYEDSVQAVLHLTPKAGGPERVFMLETSTTEFPPIAYYHTDHLGTPKALTDPAQNVVWWAEYEPFGKANITAGLVTNNLRFQGQYFDAETGLSYNYHRYYDTQSGRYITSDPIGQRGGLNTYLYANANPLIFTDPLGLFVNPVDVYNEVRDMRVEGHQRYPGEKNSSMRHCVISCLVAKKYGIPISAVAGTVNEYQGFYMHDLPNIQQRMTGGPWAFQPRGFADNYQGYKCSQENPELCSTKDEPPEATCARCCASSQ